MAVLNVSALAQPTLTAAGINPVIGDHITNNTGNYTNPGSAGANQTWNLSSIGTGTAQPCNIVSTSSTPNGSQFSSASLASSYTTTSSGTYQYYKTSSSALQNDGISITSSSTTINFIYSNPEDFLHFPFTYNNTFTDPWACTFVNGGYTYYRNGNTSVTADGYGTLTTPAGTFSGVTRLHFVQIYKDSANIGGFDYILNYHNEEYMWYLNNNHSTIATVSSFTGTSTFTTSITQTGSYMSNVVSRIENPSSYILSSNLFPNPATSSTHLTVSLTEAKAVDVKLFNALGAEVGKIVHTEGMPGTNDITLDISSFPDGIYFAEIRLEGILAESKRFIVSK